MEPKTIIAIVLVAFIIGGFIFLQVKNIAILHGCNTAYVTLCLLTCGGEIKLLCIRTQISRTIVRTCAVKECTGLHCISASLRLDQSLIHI